MTEIADLLDSIGYDFAESENVLMYTVKRPCDSCSEPFDCEPKKNRHREYDAQVWECADGDGYFVVFVTVYWDDPFSSGCSETHDFGDFATIGEALTFVAENMRKWVVGEEIAEPS